MWGVFLQRWLIQAAKERVMEHATAAVQEELQRGTGHSDPVQPPRIALLFALEIEAGRTIDRLEKTKVLQANECKLRYGLLDGIPVLLVETGVGRKRAGRAAEMLLQGPRPDWVVSAGFAGGLRPEPRRGDLVMAQSVVDPSGRELALGLRISAEQQAAMKRVHCGRLLTVDAIVRTPDEKRRLGEEHQAVAVDMETSAVAAACAEHGCRCVSVRIISDALEDELPPDLDPLLKPQSKARQLGVALGTVLNRPGSVKDLWKLKEDALTCSERLAKFLQGVVAQLAAAGPAPDSQDAAAPARLPASPS